MTGRQLLLAVLLTAAGVIKGKRLLWDAIDDMTQWVVEKTDGLDLGWDVPDSVPEAWVAEQ